MFEQLSHYGHEQVVFCSDPQSGLRAIIGIHDTTLGPALGGTRMWNYTSDNDAIFDVLRLSRGMTYKAAVAGLNLGGGKAVILGDARTQKTEALFRAYGRFVETQRGRYITAEDVGTSVRDMEWIRMETRFVTGVGGANGSGDPSPFTALGVYVGMKATAKAQFGSDSLAGKRVVVQGAGNVASYVIRHLVKEGAIVFVADIYQDKVDAICAETGATSISVDAVFTTPCDILSPNALGGILNDETISTLDCAVIAGGANNQLLEEDVHGAILKEKSILYAPDYVINAGGLINVCSEIENWDTAQVTRKVEAIYDTLSAVYSTAKEKNIMTHIASNTIAEERIARVRHIHGNYMSVPNIRGGN